MTDLKSAVCRQKSEVAQANPKSAGALLRDPPGALWHTLENSQRRCLVTNIFF